MILYRKYQQGGVISRKGDPYEYKTDGTNYYTRKKNGSGGWKKTSGKAEQAIRALFPEQEVPKQETPKQETPVEKETNVSTAGVLPDLSALTGWFSSSDEENEDTIPDVESVYRMFSNKQSPEIKNLQQLLADKGYLDDDEVDGFFGRRTATAYGRYVRDNEEETPADLLQAMNDINKANVQHCAGGVCNTFSAAGIDVNQAGMAGNNAWLMLKGITSRGGNELFNIYKDNQDKFQDVKDANDLRKRTVQILKETWKDRKNALKQLKVGDVVGMYYPGSSHHMEAYDESKNKGSNTYNTHVGYVAGIDEKTGIPLIRHNIYGKWHVDRADKVYTTWAARIPKHAQDASSPIGVLFRKATQKLNDWWD